jgi:hypothetical protein
MSQRNSLIAILNKQKCLFFFLLKNQRIGKQNRSRCGGRGIGTCGRGEDIRKGCRRVNMVEILGTHVSKWKNDIC